MAAKKDITRNPPSWLEKGLFILVLLIIVGIAFPIFWKLNQSTREYYECAGLQEELSACIERWENDQVEKWKAENVEKLKAQGKTDEQIQKALDTARMKMSITEAELAEYYGAEVPVCPHPTGDKEAKSLLKKGFIACTDHKTDFQKQTL